MFLLLFQFFFQFIFLEPVCFSHQTFDPVPVNSIFKMPAAYCKTSL